MKRLKYAMVGGGKGSFIGPVHREAIRLDDLADIVAGNFSRDAENNLATARELGLDESRVYPDWQSLIAAEKGRIDFLSIYIHHQLLRCGMCCRRLCGNQY